MLKLTMFLVLLLALLLTGCTAPPTDHQFKERSRNSDECYETRTFTVVYPEYTEGENDELIAENVTKVITTRKCCKGYVLEDRKCVLDEYVVCGNVSCKAHNAECITFEKCGKEIALFMNEGKIVSECYEGHNIDHISCSGVCVQDPCLAAACPALDNAEVSCFISGCDCQATWIRLSDRAEVNCLTGEVVGR